MGNIGWFLLIYFVAGWVLDILLTWIFVGIAAYKDRKNKNERCIDGLDQSIEDMKDQINAMDDSGNGEFKAWLIGRLLWPITVPTGIYYYWSAIKESEVKKEES